MALVTKNDPSYYRNQVLSVCLALALFTGISAYAKERTNLLTLKELNVNQTKKDKYSQLKEPKTVEELLKNLKYAFDRNWFLNDDFYAESTLKRVLGKNNDELRTHYFNSHGDETDHLVESGMLRSFGRNFKYRLHRSDKEAKPIVRDIQAGYDKTGGSLHLIFNIGTVFFEELEAVFGSGWKKQDPNQYFTNGWTPSPATSEYGNWMMEYYKDSETSKGYIGILTNEDGSIDSIEIGTQEKK